MPTPKPLLIIRPIRRIIWFIRGTNVKMPRPRAKEEAISFKRCRSSREKRRSLAAKATGGADAATRSPDVEVWWVMRDPLGAFMDQFMLSNACSLVVETKRIVRV